MGENPVSPKADTNLFDMMSAMSKYNRAVGEPENRRNFILESVATGRLLRGWPGFEGPRKGCRSVDVESAVIILGLGSKVRV